MDHLGVEVECTDQVSEAGKQLAGEVWRRNRGQQHLLRRAGRRCRCTARAKSRGRSTRPKATRRLGTDNAAIANPTTCCIRGRDRPGRQGHSARGLLPLAAEQVDVRLPAPSASSLIDGRRVQLLGDFRSARGPVRAAAPAAGRRQLPSVDADYRQSSQGSLSLLTATLNLLLSNTCSTVGCAGQAGEVPAQHPVRRSTPWSRSTSESWSTPRSRGG
jgi:hypothetical protein